MKYVEGKKGKQAKGCKKTKQRFTIAFFVSAAGKKNRQTNYNLEKPGSSMFQGLKDKSRATNIHYFSNSKSWMTSEVFEVVLSRFNRKLVFENRKVILFLDNATCHPESLIDMFSSIKIVFLPKIIVQVRAFAN